MRLDVNLFNVFLYVLGLVLLLVEAMFPGFGVAGVSGAILVVASVVLMSASFMQGLLMLIGTIAFVMLLLIVMIKLGWAKKYFRFFVLNTEQKNEEGYTSNVKYSDYLGKKGMVITPLRSAGTVMVGDVKLDAVSEGEFIDKDTVVEVIKVEGRSIIVRKAR